MQSPFLGPATLSLVLALAFGAAPLAGQVPGACETPAHERTAEIGCYLIASQFLGQLTDTLPYWHLHTYPTRAAAEAAQGPHGTVAEAVGKIWLFTIAGADWRPPNGTAVAVIGPLPVLPSEEYTARFIEAVYTPGMQTRIHTHPGPEALFVLTGGQCVETPAGANIAHAGEYSVLPAGLPMVLMGVGTELRRAVGLILHKKVGGRLARGEPLLTLRYNNDERLRAADALLAGAFTLAEAPPAPPPLIIETLE